MIIKACELGSVDVTLDSEDLLVMARALGEWQPRDELVFLTSHVDALCAACQALMVVVWNQGDHPTEVAEKLTIEATERRLVSTYRQLLGNAEDPADGLDSSGGASSCDR